MEVFGMIFVSCHPFSRRFEAFRGFFLASERPW